MSDALVDLYPSQIEAVCASGVLLPERAVWFLFQRVSTFLEQRAKRGQRVEGTSRGQNASSTYHETDWTLPAAQLSPPLGETMAGL